MRNTARISAEPRVRLAAYASVSRVVRDSLFPVRHRVPRPLGVSGGVLRTVAHLNSPKRTGDFANTAPSAVSKVVDCKCVGTSGQEGAEVGDSKSVNVGVASRGRARAATARHSLAKRLQWMPGWRLGRERNASCTHPNSIPRNRSMQTTTRKEKGEVAAEEGAPRKRGGGDDAGQQWQERSGREH